MLFVRSLFLKCWKMEPSAFSYWIEFDPSAIRHPSSTLSVLLIFFSHLITWQRRETCLSLNLLSVRSSFALCGRDRRAPMPITRWPVGIHQFIGRRILNFKWHSDSGDDSERKSTKKLLSRRQKAKARISRTWPDSLQSPLHPFVSFFLSCSFFLALCLVGLEHQPWRSLNPTDDRNEEEDGEKPEEEKMVRAAVRGVATGGGKE